MECDSKDGGNDRNNSIRSRHISKLHERVQTKYCEMKKKMERAKSIDSLSSIQEENLWANQAVAPINKSLLREVESHNKYEKIETIILDSAKENDATSLDVEYEKAVSSGGNVVPIVDLLINEDDKIKKTENEFLLDMPFKGSLESLTNVVNDKEKAISPPLNTQHQSIRSRIRLRICEARKRRQEKEKPDKTKRRNSYNNVEKMILSNTTKEHVSKIYKKTKIATVTIALIEATGFIMVEEEKPRNIGCRIRLGSEKRKSKMIKSYDSTIKFQELHSFNLYDDDYILDLVLWDKDVQIGRHTVDLSAVEKEKTHKMQIHLEDSEVQLLFLLTISGISLSEINTLYSINDNESQIEAESMRRKYVSCKCIPTDPFVHSIIF